MIPTEHDAPTVDGVLVRRLLLLWVGVILIVTVTPLSNFVGHSHWFLVRWVPFSDSSLTVKHVIDLVGNLWLYMPLGFLIAILRGRAQGYGVVLGVAALLSTGTEIIQVFEHNRVPSMTDVVMNVMGAWLGAFTWQRLRRLNTGATFLWGTPARP